MSGHFLFPFESVPQGSNIVLYGAGLCGQVFYQQVRACNYCNIVIWLDRNADEARQNFGLPVYMPDLLLETSYDLIVVAISNSQVSDAAVKDLSETFHIPMDKFITKVVDLDAHQLSHSWGEYVYVGKERHRGLEEIAPRDLVSYRRLDIAVRWMLCHDFVCGIRDEAHLSLYTRMQLARIHGKASRDYWADKPGENVEEMLSECKKLCLSIGEGGFDKEKAISLSSQNYAVIDGSHRVAASISLEKKIWVKYYGNVKGEDNYGFDWFLENGFCQDDLIRILRAYCEISRKPLGMIVLYGTVMGQWKFLQAQLRREFTEVGWYDLDFSGNFYAYETLLREIYYDASYEDFYIDFKLKFLEKAPLKLRVILLEESDRQDPLGIPFYERVAQFKETLRKAMYFETAEAPTVIHATNNAYEFRTTYPILLSVNNLHYLERRIVVSYSDSFLERLSATKKKLEEMGIPLEDCVIVGSSVMEILGLAPAFDLDLCVHSRHWDRLPNPNDPCEIVSGVGIEAASKIRDVQGNILSNDLLIENDELHFVFHGWKCANLEIYKAYMLWHTTRPEFRFKEEKYKERLRKIELYEDFVRCFSDKAALREQIVKEYFRKRFY